jgi:hypothetical protein
MTMVRPEQQCRVFLKPRERNVRECTVCKDDAASATLSEDTTSRGYETLRDTVAQILINSEEGPFVELRDCFEETEKGP